LDKGRDQGEVLFVASELLCLELEIILSAKSNKKADFSSQ
jgi:hypothetical protein